MRLADAMKEVLVIARYFAPQSVMGAVRPTKIAKYLTLCHNCRVTVITAKDTGTVCDPILQNERELFDIIEIKDVWWARLMIQIDRNFKRAGSKNASEWGYPDTRPTLFSRLYWNLKIMMESGKEMAFARRAAAAAKRSGRDFDAIFSTYGPVGVHYAAKKIKRAFTSAHWNADFRDPAYSKNLRFRRYKRRSDRLAADTERYADSITVTTPGIMTDMEWRCRREFRVVSNGFDPDDAAEQSSLSQDGRFHIVYTGSLYDEKRSFAPLFTALSELIDNRLVDASRLRFDYAGTDFALLRQSAISHGLDSLLCDHGKISRKDALRLQRQAGLLLLVSWGAADGGSDIVPGKIFEYMMSKKPVLALCPGDCGDSELRRIFDGAEMGFYFTGSDGELPQLKEYLLSVCQNPAAELLRTKDAENFVRGFDYREITDRMALIMGLAGAVSE